MSTVEKAVVNVKGKEYELKFTIGFWKRAKAELGVTDGPSLEAKLKEDFGVVAPQVILLAIHGEAKPTVEDIEETLDRSVMDVFEQAVINGMTKAEREMVEIVRKRHSDAVAKAKGEDDSKK